MKKLVFLVVCSLIILSCEESFTTENETNLIEAISKLNYNKLPPNQKQAILHNIRPTIIEKIYKPSIQAGIDSYKWRIDEIVSIIRNSNLSIDQIVDYMVEVHNFINSNLNITYSEANLFIELHKTLEKIIGVVNRNPKYANLGIYIEHLRTEHSKQPLEEKLIDPILYEAAKKYPGVKFEKLYKHKRTEIEKGKEAKKPKKTK